MLSVWHCLCVWPLSLGPLHLFIYALLFHPHVGSSRCVCLHSHFIYFLFFSKPPKPLSHSALSLCLFLILQVSSSPQCSAVLANLDSDFWDACNVSWNSSVFLDLVGSYSYWILIPAVFFKVKFISWCANLYSLRQTCTHNRFTERFKPCSKT